MCGSQQPTDGADSGWYPDMHVCTKEDCGHECRWEGGVPLTTIHSVGMDADDQPCPCPDHLT